MTIAFEEEECCPECGAEISYQWKNFPDEPGGVFIYKCTECNWGEIG